MDKPISRGIADAMDDPGARQHSANQAEIEVIAGQLVDDAASGGRQRMELGQIGFGRRVTRRPV